MENWGKKNQKYRTEKVIRLYILLSSDLLELYFNISFNYYNFDPVSINFLKRKFDSNIDLV